MSTSFPTALDSYTNPVSTEVLGTAAGIGVAALITNLNDAVTALETKVGITSSAVATTIDYLLKNTSSINPGHKHTASSLTNMVDLASYQAVSNKYIDLDWIFNTAFDFTDQSSNPSAPGSGMTRVFTKSNVLYTKNNSSTVDAIVSGTATQTLTNKRVTKRITTITSSATPAINTDICDAVDITTLAAAITSMTSSLTGTPTNFQTLIIRFKDDGTARTIAWGNKFEARGVALPTTTVLSKVLTVGLIWDTTTSKWGCVASQQET